MAFYEPLHGILARNRETLMAVRPDAWASGHPESGTPYFSEFLPLLKEAGGVRNYDPGIEMDRFDVDPDSELPELKLYLESLLSAATGRRETAVLKFCRSMGRMRWMIRAFPDVAHVVVLRNPSAQWASSWSQMTNHGNPWFVAAPYHVLGANLGSARVRRIMRALECDGPDFHSVAAQAAEETRLERVKSVPVDFSYRVWLAHWILCAMSVDQDVSMFVDSDLLGVSRRYARLCAGELHRATGIEPKSLNVKTADCVLEMRSPITWMGLHDEPALHWHLKAGEFLQAEIGNDPTEKMAFGVIQSKLAVANEQVKRGGAPFNPSEVPWMERTGYCVDELSLQALLHRESRLLRNFADFSMKVKAFGLQVGTNLRVVN